MRHSSPLTVKDRFLMFLFYQDKHTNHEFFGDRVPYMNITERVEDLYYECNCLRIEYQLDKKNKSLHLSFFTDNSMPNFKCFAITYPNVKKQWF